MKQKRLLVDRSAEVRGFFSTINLLLLTLHYCAENDIEPIVSSSVLSLYGTQPRKVRPFSEFFGNIFADQICETDKLEIMDIAHVHDSNLLNFENPTVITQLSILNKILLNHLTDEVENFISNRPSGEYFDSTMSVHFRGCDYLKNTPQNHRPNLSPSEFLAKIDSLIPKEPIFIATDDISFIDLALTRERQVSYFTDVYRRGPGKGSHMKSFLQKTGLVNLRAQRRKGLEVFRDVYWLSKSDTYVGSNSNLMYYSRLLNPNQKLININPTA
jgi:hypothetical protein